ncbi:unnamed protein product [Amoebophrya sp. A120]|nr:unnamed protein product [Amoebophrya sp. A120]|eukprot:GSA120T00025759001.1
MLMRQDVVARALALSFFPSEPRRDDETGSEGWNIAQSESVFWQKFAFFLRLPLLRLPRVSRRRRTALGCLNLNERGQHRPQNAS